MEFAGGSPLSITWENRGDEFYVPVKASEATINVMCHDNFHFIGLFFQLSGRLSLWNILTAKGRDLVYVLSKENYKLDVLGG